MTVWTGVKQGTACAQIEETCTQVPAVLLTMFTGIGRLSVSSATSVSGLFIVLGTAALGFEMLLMLMEDR